MSERSDIPIVILAAGSSSRMRGEDKLMQRVEGRALIRRQFDIAAEVSQSVYVALPPPPHPRYGAVADTSAKIIEVPNASEGMGASIRTAFAALPPNTRAAMLLLADLPELTASDLRAVIDRVDLAKDTLVWRGTTQSGKPGNPVVFARALFDDLLRLSGDTGGYGVVAAAGTRVELIPLPENRARADLDTPEEWAAWRAAQRN